MRLLVVALSVLVASSALAQDVPPPVTDDELMSPSPETGAPVEPKAAAVASPVDPGQDPGAFVSAVANAVKGGRWLTVVSLAVVLVVFLLRRFGAKWVPWFQSKRGGVVLAFACAALASISSSLAVGWSWGCLVSAAEAGLMAIGLWSAAKNSAGA